MLASNHQAIKQYYETLTRYDAVDAQHEQAVKTAFHNVLQAAAGSEWTLVPEFTTKGRTGKTIRYDGALRDEFRYTLGYWEAKDSADNLDREIQRKIERGYSLQNTIFQAPDRAVLYQDRRVVLDVALSEPRRLAEVLDQFFRYQEPEIEQFRQAVSEFKEAIPDLAAGLLGKIEQARKTDTEFQKVFAAFVETVRESVNPNVAIEAVEEMLIQHLLTERIIRTIFNNRDFARRNAIAIEIEKVIDALTARHMSREDFLDRLDRFYRAIEEAAEGITDWAEKQEFLNTVYEQFFQGFSERVADTHGIVYTPQPLVDFMVRSVDALLQHHFNQRLEDEGIHILDPFVGTGNFIVRTMEQIPAPALSQKYRTELHANEVMLLPYYVASLNIEHAYREKVGSYVPFPGIVLVDTFEMVEGKTVGMFSAENTERAQRQRQSPIKVILGNPPYNAHQVNANDANQNRKYPHMDRRVRETYSSDSNAQNKNALGDPYVKAFRWATDRLGSEGIVAFVTNNSFIDSLSFDGMRQHLERDFSTIYVLDLKGNIRTDSMRDGIPLGEKHTIFGLSAMVGISITFLVRDSSQKGICQILYHAADWRATREEKFRLLEQAVDIKGIDWRELEPNKRHVWLTDDLNDEWEDFLPLASAEEKASGKENKTTILDEYGSGIKTGRDVWVYDFDREPLADRVELFVDTYNAQVVKWQRKGGTGIAIEKVVTHEDQKIKWDASLKRSLKSNRFADFDADKIRPAMYRPFVSKWLYFDPMLVQRQYQWPTILPATDAENRIIWLKVGAAWPMFALMVDRVADLLPQGGSQCLPFYLYRANGTREENLTDWALSQFRDRYDDPGITKWDVFHYVYAILHHPAYRERYAADLKRSLPRIPFAPVFSPFAEAGRMLADLHVGYEDGPEYSLHLIHTPGTPLDYCIEKMKLDEEAGTLRLNASLMLDGLPPEAHRYHLGNRSALEWLVDQLRIKTDKRSGITHDPNAAFKDDELVSLIKRVTHVSVETVRLIDGMPDLGLPEA